MNIDSLDAKAARILSRPLRLLIVEDNPHDLELLKAMWMEIGGVCVLEARDGPEAIELADRQAWDFAIVDLKLPGMSGVDVIAHLKKLRQTVAAITGSPEGHAAEAARRFPVLAIYEKPFTFQNCADLLSMFGLRIAQTNSRNRTNATR